MSTVEASKVYDNPVDEAVMTAGDGTSLRLTVPEITAQLADIGAKAKNALSRLRANMTASETLCIARLQLLLTFQLPNGMIDWAASSQTYRNLLAIAEAGVWDNATADEKRRIDTATRVMKTRVFLEPFITKHVIDSTPNLLTDDERIALRWSEKKEGYPILVGEVPPKLRDAIAAEYVAAGIDVPTKFGGTKDKDKPGPGNEPKTNPVAAFDKALGGLSNVSGDVAMAALLRAASAVFANVNTKDARYGESGPEGFAALAHRTATVCEASGKHAVGKLNDNDRKAAEAAVWVTEDRK